ncbi:hypothetical protein CROQUDRAFT_587609 [Cronartium quercuum f. sp. fusiforme G11]|uniref:Uncharacterized protein n=1 Tax=Cronartium quercuum f. sp. fusiforme G11 TaxID=708437 RepID=A0A9P6TAZ1_9BASI|nr:hypothetical protein CROQUDRAFT_587609 [Cronartium quercuum f. sp. fusiforme G11]
MEEAGKTNTTLDITHMPNTPTEDEEDIDKRCYLLAIGSCNATRFNLCNKLLGPFLSNSEETTLAGHLTRNEIPEHKR